MKRKLIRAAATLAMALPLQLVHAADKPNILVIWGTTSVNSTSAPTIWA